MITAARNACSVLGFLIPHNSEVGLRGEIRIESFGQALMQLAHRLQSALLSMVRTYWNIGQPSTLSVPW
ncbi:hypothetical protein D3C75_1209250 [compost metagenome]